MAAQQIQIAETIRAMKLALKRRPDGMPQFVYQRYMFFSADANIQM